MSKLAAKLIKLAAEESLEEKVHAYMDARQGEDDSDIMGDLTDEEREREWEEHMEDEEGQDEYPDTPFADDVEDFASMANELDEQGFYQAANEVDSLIIKLAAKQAKPGRNFAQWLRQLKKMKAGLKVVETFRKTYKEALGFAKKKDKLKGKEEVYALREAVKKLPKKYLKEPKEKPAKK